MSTSRSITRCAKTPKLARFQAILSCLSGVVGVRSERLDPEGQRAYDFSWLNGPNEGSYGFTIGMTNAQSHGLAPAGLEREARAFVLGFFSPGGIGDTDFPEFVAARIGR